MHGSQAVPAPLLIESASCGHCSSTVTVRWVVGGVSHEATAQYYRDDWEDVGDWPEDQGQWLTVAHAAEVAYEDQRRTEREWGAA